MITSMTYYCEKCGHKLDENERRCAFCIMNLRVVLSGKVKRLEPRIRSESESEEGVESEGTDAKPCDLPLARLKDG